MTPASVMDGLLVGRNDFWAPNEALTRFGFPPASQDLIGLPELGAGGTGGLVFPGPPQPKQDTAFGLQQSGEPRLWPLTPHT